MNRFAQMLATLSDAEAQAVYNALAQWADNERNGLEEAPTFTDQEKAELAKHDVQVSLVEGVVERLEARMVEGL